MKFLIVACLLAAVAAEEEKLSEAEEKACVSGYLDGGNLTSECETVIRNLEKQVTGFIVRDETFDWTVNCIKEYMKNYNVFEFFLRTELEAKPEENVAVQLLEIEVRNTIQSICTRLYGFDGFFEQMVGEFKSKRSEKYQCMYKYGIEKKFIDKNDFDFDTSAFDSFNCTGFFQQFDEEFKEMEPPIVESQSKFEKCVGRKFSGFNILRGVEIITAIGTFELSDVQKEKFKAFYLDWFTAGERPILECVHDVYKKTV